MSNNDVYGIVHVSSRKFASALFCLWSRDVRKLPVKLTDPVTPILYITSDKQHMEELKHAIHVKSIDEGLFQFLLTLYLHSRASFLFNVTVFLLLIVL